MYILWLPSTLHSSPAPVTRMCDGLEPIQGPTIMYLVKQIKDTIIDILLRVQGVTKVVDIKYAIKLSDVQAQEKRFVCRPANQNSLHDASLTNRNFQSWIIWRLFWLKMKILLAQILNLVLKKEILDNLKTF